MTEGQIRSHDSTQLLLLSVITQNTAGQVSSWWNNACVLIEALVSCEGNSGEDRAQILYLQRVCDLGRCSAHRLLNQKLGKLGAPFVTQ